MLIVDHLGGWPFGAIIGLAAVVGVLEFYIMMRAGGYRPAVPLGIAAGLALALWPLETSNPQQAWIAILVILVCGAGAWYLVPAVYQTGLGGWLTTVAGATYVGLLLGHLTLLRSARDGAWWILAALLMTWAYDTGAYFAGTYLGRRPFMHHVSPKKTVEGVAGGLALSAIAGLVIVPTIGVEFWKALLLGLAAGAVCQTGDLVESMLKRQVGVKDSGTLMPGHGGLLDRIDGLLFTGALTYYAAALLGYAA